MAARGISQVDPNSGNNAGIATLIPTPAFSSNNGGTPRSSCSTSARMDRAPTPPRTDLKGLLDKLFTNAPNALVVLAQIIPLGYAPNNVVIKAYNQPSKFSGLQAHGRQMVRRHRSAAAEVGSARPRSPTARQRLARIRTGMTGAALVGAVRAVAANL